MYVSKCILMIKILLECYLNNHILFVFLMLFFNIIFVAPTDYGGLYR